jgi:hypothetical protein
LTVVSVIESVKEIATVREIETGVGMTGAILGIPVRSAIPGIGVILGEMIIGLIIALTEEEVTDGRTSALNVAGNAQQNQRSSLRF